MGQSGERPAVNRRVLPWLGAAVLTLVALGAIDVATSTEPGPEAVRVPPAVTGPELIACAHNIVIGEVRRAEEPGRHQSTVDVTIDAREWLKPGSRKRSSVEFTTLAPWYSGERRLRPGDDVLVIEWSYPYESASRVFRADARRGLPTLADVRAQIGRDLPQSRHTRCPVFWSVPVRYHEDVPEDA